MIRDLEQRSENRPRWRWMNTTRVSGNETPICMSSPLICTWTKPRLIWYELHGDYYLPCLTVPPEEQRPIGIWGQRHLRYLRQHRKALYTELQITGKLNGYLSDLDEQAENLFL